jgi:hypothetical protein
MPNYVLSEREYAAIQRAALAAEPIQRAAGTWRCLIVSRETDATHSDGPGIAQMHLVCLACDQSVFRLPVGEPVAVKWWTVLDHIAAHIRQVHEDTLGNP